MKLFEAAENPVVSVVIVYYNQLKKLLTCLESVQQQDYLKLEVLLINTSADPLLIQPHLSKWVQIHNISNQGYAQALNYASTFAHGDYYLLLNADTELFADTIRQLLELARDYPKAILNPQTHTTSGTLDSLGNQMHYTGMTSRLTTTQPRLDTRVCDLPALSGAVIFLPRATFMALHGFDEDYFMYFEDTDFSLRAKLLGFELLGCCDCSVVHDSEFKLDSKKFYHLERNRLMLILKIYQTTTLLKILPALGLTALITLGFACTKGFNYISAWFKVLSWLLTHKTWLLEKRSRFQAERLLPDQVFLSSSTTTLPFAALTKQPIAKVLTSITTPFYQLFKWLL